MTILEVRLKGVAVFVYAAALATGTVGIGNMAMGVAWHKAQTDREEVKGRILVSAGPDVSVACDRNGDVLGAKRIDQAGRDFLGGQGGYFGKDCKDVVKCLVRHPDGKGWFNRKTASPKNSLMIKAEKGSWYPNDNFMKEIEEGVWDVMESRDVDVCVKAVRLHALNGKEYMDGEAAKKMALEQLGPTTDDPKIKEHELDDSVYGIEVVIDDVIYEVNLDAVTGEIVNMDRDDDNDGRYDSEDDDDHDDGDDDCYDDDHDDENDDGHGDGDHNGCNND